MPNEVAARAAWALAMGTWSTVCSSKNRATKQRIVDLSYPGTHEIYRERRRSDCTTRSAWQADEASVSLLQPPMEAAGGREMRIQGVSIRARRSQWKACTRGTTQRRRIRRRCCSVEAFRRIFTNPRARKWNDACRSVRGPGRPRSAARQAIPTRWPPRRQLVRSPSCERLPVRQWSPNWLGYSCYDAIVLSQGGRRDAGRGAIGGAAIPRMRWHAGGTRDNCRGRSRKAAFRSAKAATGRTGPSRG